MRIIGGRYHGRVLRVPKGLPVRPTTDFAKEGLFNILNNRLAFEDLHVLDLFSGTGHISLEFASRGCAHVTSVDQHAKCIAFLKEMAGTLDLPVNAVWSDVFQFLEQNRARYDVIFADPPYDLSDISKIHQMVFSKDILLPGGFLIIEHGAGTKLQELQNFLQHRKYGNVNFSFFQTPAV